jgi:4'-phosphopantetheinyl transferase EntD
MVASDASTGERLWPHGFVGSLSHKGPIVLGAIAPTSVYRGIGVDLERYVPGELKAISGDIAAEGIPPGISEDFALAIVFSAKEAVYKAQYPITRQPVGFAEVRLTWKEATASSAQLETGLGTLRVAVICALVGKWLVAAAEVGPAVYHAGGDKTV